jgi:hypothetical protein
MFPSCSHPPLIPCVAPDTHSALVVTSDINLSCTTDRIRSLIHWPYHCIGLSVTHDTVMQLHYGLLLVTHNLVMLLHQQLPLITPYLVMQLQNGLTVMTLPFSCTMDYLSLTNL